MLLVEDLGSIEQHILAAVSKGFQKQMCLPVDAGLVSRTDNEREEHNNILALFLHQDFHKDECCNLHTHSNSEKKDNRKVCLSWAHFQMNKVQKK